MCWSVTLNGNMGSLVNAIKLYFFPLINLQYSQYFIEKFSFVKLSVDFCLASFIHIEEILVIQLLISCFS